MLDGTDICMPALWCAEPTLIAYSKDGYESRRWELPSDWKDVKGVSIARITPDGPESIEDVPVKAGKIALSLGEDEAVMVGQC